MTLDEVVLNDPDGHPVALADLAGPILVVQLVRYFGCLPCQEWLMALNRASGQLAARGAQPVAVGGSADYQARWLRDERQVTMPLLVDPAQQVRSIVGFGDLGARLADPRGLLSYAKSLSHGFRPQRVTHDTLRSPGVVILDEHLAVRWRHEGHRIGDYPPVGDVTAIVAALSDGRR